MSGDDVRCDLIFDKRDAIAQLQLALFQALQPEQVRRRRLVQCLDCGIKIAMLLLQPRKFESKFVVVLIYHNRR